MGWILPPDSFCHWSFLTGPFWDGADYLPTWLGADCGVRPGAGWGVGGHLLTWLGREKWLLPPPPNRMTDAVKSRFSVLKSKLTNLSSINIPWCLNCYDYLWVCYFLIIRLYRWSLLPLTNLTVFSSFQNRKTQIFHWTVVRPVCVMEVFAIKMKFTVLKSRIFKSSGKLVMSVRHRI